MVLLLTAWSEGHVIDGIPWGKVEIQERTCVCMHVPTSALERVYSTALLDTWGGLWLESGQAGAGLSRAGGVPSVLGAVTIHTRWPGPPREGGARMPSPIRLMATTP